MIFGRGDAIRMHMIRSRGKGIYYFLRLLYVPPIIICGLDTYALKAHNIPTNYPMTPGLDCSPVLEANYLKFEWFVPKTGSQS